MAKHVTLTRLQALRVRRDRNRVALVSVESTAGMTALGIALLVAGIALLVAEAHVPAGGALGAAGLVALVAGGLSVAAAGGIALALALPVAVGVGVAGGAALVIGTRKATQAGRLRVRSGREALVGQVGVVRSPPAPVGQVLVDGALWRAQRGWDGEVDEPLRQGDRVVVESVDGLTLSVRRAEEWEESP